MSAGRVPAPPANTTTRTSPVGPQNTLADLEAMICRGQGRLKPAMPSSSARNLGVWILTGVGIVAYAPSRRSTRFNSNEQAAELRAEA